MGKEEETIYCCVSNNSHVFCEIGDSGEADYWREELIKWAQEERVSDEHLEYLQSLSDNELINYISKFFLLEFEAI